MVVRVSTIYKEDVRNTLYKQYDELYETVCRVAVRQKEKGLSPLETLSVIVESASRLNATLDNARALGVPLNRPEVGVAEVERMMLGERC